MEGDLLGGIMQWQLALWLIGGALGALFLMGRAFAARIARDLDERLAKIDRVADEMQRLDDELSRVRAEMPVHYIRRDDHIRDITNVSIKLDRIYELLLIRGMKND